jgi:peptidoglycan-associated lipoprotein
MERFKIWCLLVVVVPAAVITTGCAKQPSTAATSVPSPPGPTSELAEPAPAAPAGGPTETAAAPGAPVAPDRADRVEPARPEVTISRPDVKRFKPTTKLRDIHFDFDAYDIRPEDSKILDADIDWIQSNPNHLILIEGHCDERGTNEYNLALGEHRARAALSYMLAHGVQASRFTTLSYGEERPACIERTEECWAKNRRAHFLVKLATPPR